MCVTARLQPVTQIVKRNTLFQHELKGITATRVKIYMVIRILPHLRIAQEVYENISLLHFNQLRYGKRQLLQRASERERVR